MKTIIFLISKIKYIIKNIVNKVRYIFFSLFLTKRKEGFLHFMSNNINICEKGMKIVGTL